MSIENSFYQQVEACRSCGARKLTAAVSLGEQYIIDFPEPGGLEQQAPLILVKCGSCHLVQLEHTVNQDRLFGRFWYQSSISPSMSRDLKDVVDKAILALPELKRGEAVVDIGSNDGTLLRHYPSSLTRIGFEPASNVAAKAGRSIMTINSYFNAENYLRLGYLKAKIITAIAMFYDLPDPNSFVADVVRIMDNKGVFVIQQNYLPYMLERNGFDNIVHEHLEYYCLTSLEPLLNRHGLRIFRMTVNEVNGGSFRVYACFKNQYPEEPQLSIFRKAEIKQGLDKDTPYLRFAEEIRNVRKRLRNLIGILKDRGKTVFVLGAGTRGNTILQYCGLDYTLIDGAVDRNPEKWGRITAGGHIPIMSRDKAGKPDYFLVLPYHFLDEFEAQERDYLANGGRFILPLPEPRILP